MGRNKGSFFKKLKNNQFKRKGVDHRGGWNNSSGRAQSLGNSQPTDTIYRMLCPSQRIGSVLGKGGSIVKALREETRAKISVTDSVPGSDERLIVIFSSPAKFSRKQNNDEDFAGEDEQGLMEPICAAQNALLKIHDRIVEDDLCGGMQSDDQNENSAATARLIVPNNVVGCLLGKGGDVIQKLRSETGANIRIRPAKLPGGAMSSDELVQISGKEDNVKKALYEVSTLLHQNPSKDRPSSNFSMPYGSDLDFHHCSPPVANLFPPGTPMWSPRYSSSNGLPPMQWMEGYGNPPNRARPDVFIGDPCEHGPESLAEFSMKIVCSVGRVGSVIGKGGTNVRQLEQETGTRIEVDEALTGCDECVICVTAFESFWNPRSQTIEAILLLQHKTSEFLEKGRIITRILIPSKKVGCILGEGGKVINEMRWRTQAEIRVFSKDDKPKCASKDEELVQVSGSFVVAKEALAEIASRLRVRTLRDANGGPEPAPVRPVREFGATRRMANKAIPPVRAFSPGGYEPLEGDGPAYEPPNYPVPREATGYLSMDNSLGARIGIRGSNVSIHSGANIIPRVCEVAGSKLKLEGPYYGGYEPTSFAGQEGKLEDPQSYAYDRIRPADLKPENPQSDVSSEYFPSFKNPFQSSSFTTSTGHYENAQHCSYNNVNAQQSFYQYTTTHHGYKSAVGTHQNMHSTESLYQNTTDSHTHPNRSANSQHNLYPSTQQGDYR